MAFLDVASTPMYNHAKVIHEVVNSADEVAYEISVRWSKADVENEITRTYMRDISLIKSSDGHLSRVYQGKVLCSFMKFFSTRKYQYI